LYYLIIIVADLLSILSSLQNDSQQINCLSVMDKKIAIFWFRRDLRLNDNAALYAALNSGLPVLPLFIFDEEILDRLPSRHDGRVIFIHRELHRIKDTLEAAGSSLIVRYGSPVRILDEISGQYNVSAVYSNRDYEPYAYERDRKVGEFLFSKAIEFHLHKDHVVFEENEVLKSDGSPYTIFTPYSRKWKEKLQEQTLISYPSEEKMQNFLQCLPLSIPSLSDMGFIHSDIVFPGSTVPDSVLLQYENTRNLPAVEGTSRLGVHLRFGTISIRELTRQAIRQSDVFLNELIWRNFFIQIMANFPYVINGPFKKQYAFIQWRNNEKEFEKWCKGQTGYPMVDAGMRQLNQTGYMHNRVRMVTASFLTKHLLIDWRWGEAYFAEKLLDYELASNNGNWQWAAGTGCDAAPYFRVFNPETQQQKFDLQGEYIRHWVPEAGTIAYIPPIVDHATARIRAIETYKKTLSRQD
jgi:deoxyribodipyrimidine photo-lyase